MSGTLHTGQSISHYRVISSLGAGGMGEVYMAKDETLERTVALKILPPDLVRNEERMRRFVQEAKSASSLSHPHIVTIYEIGKGEPRPEGADDAAPSDTPPIHFIAMELITGETLKQKIHEEKTELRVLARYLAQAAEGLAKAHSAGIVHRDLKPENIMITMDGYAKVLDFGLAKLTERKEMPGGISSAPTRAQEYTRDGALLGTVGYMSPEQVLAKPVDHRSDVFSFGCILYEAATRRKPFTADSDVETMHKILRDTPTPVDELNPDVPRVVRRVIRRCLAKNPDRRFQSMKDLAIELNEIVEEYDDLTTATASSGSGSGSSTGTLTATGGMGLRLKVGIVAVALIGVTGIAFGIYGLMHRDQSASAGPAPFQSMKMTRLTSSGQVRDAALSPDGKYLAHAIDDAGAFSLHVRQVATGSDVQIVPPQATSIRGVSFSPDGNYVYYIRQETEGPGYSVLFQVPVLGGTTRKLIFDIDSGVTFSPDGSRIAFTRGYPHIGESALMVANADGTDEEKLAVRKTPEGFQLVGASWSPDGERIVAIGVSMDGGFHLEPVAVDIRDGTETPIGDKRWSAVGGAKWLPDGSGIVLTASDQRGSFIGQVWFLSYPGGDAHRISNDLNGYRGISVTNDSRTLATIRANRIANLWKVPVGDSSAGRQITFGTGNEDAIGQVSTATAGTVIFVAAENDFPHIWSIDSEGSNRTRLTSGDTVNVDPSVSLEGRVIAFTSVRQDVPPHIWTMGIDGGNLRRITDGSGERMPTISPDGRWILYQSIADGGVWKIPTEGGTPIRITENLMGGVDISHDGSRVVYEVYEQGADRLVRTLSVISPDDGSQTHSFPFPDGFRPRWNPPGDALSYFRQADGVWNVWSQPLDGGPPVQVTDFKSGRIFTYDWSPDGKTLYLSRGQTSNDVVLISDFR